MTEHPTSPALPQGADWFQRDLFVRARNGFFYRDPVLIFRYGYLYVSDAAMLRAVLFVQDDAAPAWLPASAQAAIALVLGLETIDCDALELVGRAQAVIPNTEPWQYVSADTYRAPLLRRIPIPKTHRGEERYAGRIRGRALVDLPAHPRDAAELHFEF